MLPIRSHLKEKPSIDLYLPLNRAVSEPTPSQYSSRHHFGNSNELISKIDHKIKPLEKHSLGSQVLEFDDKKMGSRLRLRHRRFQTGRNHEQVDQKCENEVHSRQETNYDISCSNNSDADHQLSEFSSQPSNSGEVVLDKQNMNSNECIQAVKKKSGECHAELDRLVLPDSCSSTETQPIREPSNTCKIARTSLDCYRRIICEEQRYQSKEHIVIQEGQCTTHGQHECESFYCITMAKTKPIKLEKNISIDQLPIKKIGSEIKEGLNQVQLSIKRVSSIDTISYLRVLSKKSIVMNKKTIKGQQKYTSPIKKPQSHIQTTLAHHPSSGSINSSEQQCSYKRNVSNLHMRLGLAPKHYALISSQNMSMNAMENINNQLDLGIKSIDDSFEISAIDQQARSHEIYINGTPSCKHLNRNNCGLNEVQQFILDESIVSPECEELREKLDGILYDEGRMQKFENTIYNSSSNQNNSILLLELNSFNKSNTEYKQAALSRHVLQDKSKFKLISDNFVTINKLGFIVNRVEFEITDLELIGLIPMLNQLVSCPSICFITDLYAYQLHQEQSIPARLILFKQPINPFAAMYRLSQLIDTNTHLTISSSNVKSIIRQIVFVMGHCEKYFSKICILNAENVSLVKIMSLDQNQGCLGEKTYNQCQYCINVDFSTIESLRTQITPNKRCDASSNSRTVSHIIRYLYSCVKANTHLSQEQQQLYIDFANRIDDMQGANDEQSMLGLLYELSTHPLIYSCFRELDVFDSPLANIL